MSESKLNKIIDTSLGNIKQIIDVNTVVGEPISTAGGTVIIPVSKVSLGYASGGVDYYGKNKPATGDAASFGGGGGTGVTLNPVGFLVTKADGSTEFLPVTTTPPAVVAPAPDKVDTLISFIERSPELLAKIKAMIPQKKKKEETEEAATQQDAQPATEETTEAAE